MHISQHAYNHYWEKGWVAVEGVYSPDEVERIAQIAIEVSDREMETPETTDQGIGYALIERKTVQLHREKSMHLSSKNLTSNPSYLTPVSRASSKASSV